MNDEVEVHNTLRLLINDLSQEILPSIINKIEHSTGNESDINLLRRFPPRGQSSNKEHMIVNVFNFFALLMCE